MFETDRVTIFYTKDGKNNFCFTQEDMKRDELRLFHKLTESHVMPFSWEKMNVKLAAQLLSQTVGMYFSVSLVPCFLLTLKLSQDLRCKKKDIAVWRNLFSPWINGLIA